MPYCLAVVDLEEGFSMMTNIVGINPESVWIGMKVAVSWERLGPMVLPVFTPLETESGRDYS